MIKIVIDSREQAPYLFEGYDVKIERDTLATGDYSITGFADMVAVERKELGDLIGCLTHDRARFMRELERLRGFQSAALVVEAPFSMIAGGQYRSQMSPDSAVQSLFSFMERYRLPCFFADNRAMGEYFVYNFLRLFVKHTKIRYTLIQGME